MKLPKKFSSMSAKEQERFLVQKLRGVEEEADEIRKILAAVRGGKKIQLVTDDRPDEILLKD